MRILKRLCVCELKIIWGKQLPFCVSCAIHTSVKCQIFDLLVSKPPTSAQRRGRRRLRELRKFK